MFEGFRVWAAAINGNAKQLAATLNRLDGGRQRSYTPAWIYRQCQPEATGGPRLNVYDQFLLWSQGIHQTPGTNWTLLAMSVEQELARLRAGWRTSPGLILAWQAQTRAKAEFDCALSNAQTSRTELRHLAQACYLASERVCAALAEPSPDERTLPARAGLS